MIHSVTGPCEPSELGRVLMHEHVMTRSPGVSEDYPDTYPREEIVSRCADLLTQLRDRAGVRTVVDHSTIEFGRDVRLLREISQRSGVRILAPTGLWYDPPMYFRFRSAEHAAELFIRDVADGIGGSGIRPGFVKCGIDEPGLTPAVRNGIRAAALTHRATGIPISAHTWTGNRSGEHVVEVLTDEGVDMRRVVIGHSGDTEDLDYLRGLLSSGAWLGMDRFGVEDRLADERRVAVVAALCREGYAGRMVLSTDASYWSGRLSEEYKQKTRPNWSPWRLFDFVVPKLLQAGVAEQDVERMLVGNPQAIFTPDQPY